MSLINCEVNPILTWSENCVIRNKAYRKANAKTVIVRISNPTNATFKIEDTKLHVPVVILSITDDDIFLKQLKPEFNRTIKWNKYRSEMTNQTKTNQLKHLIDSTFTKVNRLFVLSFENKEDKTSFSNYYVPKVEIKDFNVLINGKNFLMCQ